MKRNIHLFAILILISCTLCIGQNRVGKAILYNKAQNQTFAWNDKTERKFTIGRVDFSGEWKLNEAKSESVNKFPLCIFGGGDRGRSKIMRIAAHTNFLVVDVASSSSNGELVTRREKLTFGDQEPSTTFVGTPRETSVARWSDDGQAMVVHSVRSLESDREKVDFMITEIWRMSNDGKSIIVKVNSRSDSGEHEMKLVYDKQRAADYRF